MTRSNLGWVRIPPALSAVVAIAALALSAFVAVPASAQGSGSWTLDCKGDSAGSVSWNWLLNGAPISGADGSALCSATMSVTGSIARPANANGFAAVVHVFAGDKTDSKSVNQTFGPDASLKVKLSASVSDRFWNCDPERKCFWVNAHEGAQFSLEA